MSTWRTIAARNAGTRIWAQLPGIEPDVAAVPAYVAAKHMDVRVKTIGRREIMQVRDTCPTPRNQEIPIG